MHQDGRGEWSLVFFTLLTQLSVGTFVLWGLPAALLPAPSPFNTGALPRTVLLVVLATLSAGTLSAGTHLGRDVALL